MSAKAGGNVLGELYFVTSNKNKVMELGRLLSASFNVIQKDVGYPEIQADSLEDVVHHGLQQLSDKGVNNVIIEDSGFFIDSYVGFPGVYSAQVFRSIGCSGILKLMDSEYNRGAVFKAVMGLLYRGAVHVVVGECRGTIAQCERGGSGFGYDPIFIPEGDDRTFGEMDASEKNVFSHRARAGEALANLLDRLVKEEQNGED